MAQPTQVDPVDDDLSAVGVHQAHQEPSQRRLARTGRTDKGGRRAGANLDRDAGERGVLP